MDEVFKNLYRKYVSFDTKEGPILESIEHLLEEQRLSKVAAQALMAGAIKFAFDLVYGNKLTIIDMPIHVEALHFLVKKGKSMEVKRKDLKVALYPTDGLVDEVAEEYMQGKHSAIEAEHFIVLRKITVINLIH